MRDADFFQADIGDANLDRSIAHRFRPDQVVELPPRYDVMAKARWNAGLPVGHRSRAPSAGSVNGERSIGLRYQGFDAPAGRIPYHQVRRLPLLDGSNTALVCIPDDQPPVGFWIDCARSPSSRISQDVAVISNALHRPGAAPLGVANHIVLGNGDRCGSEEGRASDKNQ
jgi:hypothetical protein